MFALEHRILGIASLLCLAAWGLMYIIGAGATAVWIIRLICLLLLISIALLEMRKPWWGFYVFLIIWPFMLMIREFLVMMGGTLWMFLPEFWTGPMAAALSTGFWMRTKNVSITGSCNSKHSATWLNFARVSLWAFSLSYFISGILASIRLLHPPSDWFSEITEWTSFLSENPFSTLMPLSATLNTLPPLLLGLLLLNWLFQAKYRRESNEALQITVNRMLTIAAMTGICVGAYILYQIATQTAWPFNLTPPSGPFTNRTIATPLLVVFGLLCLSAPADSLGGRIIFVISGIILIGTSLFTGSRNGALMLLILLWLSSLIHMNKKRAILMISIIVLILLVIFVLPLPHIDSFSQTTVTRSIDTLRSLREKGLAEAMEIRYQIYGTALSIWKDYPLTGAGPKTFVMLVHFKARYGDISKIAGDVINHAHNAPLHFLAEAGPIACISWIMLWIAWPFIALIRWKRGNLLALTIFMVGVANQLDLMWLTPGLLTFCILILFWASVKGLYSDERNNI